jgi:hypothetical protein
MTKQANEAKSSITPLVVSAALILILIALVVFWDLWNRHPRSIDCGDGKRYRIDTRQFDTQYFAYSMQLEATVNDKSKISVKLNPNQVEKLSEAMQSANEFRKYVVAGFNSCGINKDQYGQLGKKFQALDNLAREINVLATQPARSEESGAKLASLVDEYADLVRKLGAN